MLIGSIVMQVKTMTYLSVKIYLELLARPQTPEARNPSASGYCPELMKDKED